MKVDKVIRAKDSSKNSSKLKFAWKYIGCDVFNVGCFINSQYPIFLFILSFPSLVNHWLFRWYAPNLHPLEVIILFLSKKMLIFILICFIQEQTRLWCFLGNHVRERLSWCNVWLINHFTQSLIFNNYNRYRPGKVLKYRYVRYLKNKFPPVRELAINPAMYVINNVIRWLNALIQLLMMYYYYMFEGLYSWKGNGNRLMEIINTIFWSPLILSNIPRCLSMAPHDIFLF